MNTKSIIGLLLFAGAGYFFWNSYSLKQKIAELRKRLAEADRNPPTRNSADWINYIQNTLDLLALTKKSFSDVKTAFGSLWEYGGQFFGKAHAPSAADVDLLIRKGDVTYDDYV